MFIYLFYRADKTAVNEIVIRLISFETYINLKAYITAALPLNDTVVYSLPEGLWVFCITLTSKPYYITLINRRVNLVFMPLLICIVLEVFQLFHITNGRFDFMDIGVSVIFWILGNYVLKDGDEKQDIMTRPNLKMVICLASYGIVYLAHVFK
nr:hypothetical protein [Mucilaginibacter sp. AK015]